MREIRIPTALGDIPTRTGGAGDTILFLHGGIASPLAYDGLLDELSRTHSVVAPTHPGHGTAPSITPDWPLSGFVAHYRELLRTLPQEPALVAGHSFGGMLALLMADALPGVPIIAFDPAGLPLSLTPKEYVTFMAKEARDLVGLRPDLKMLKETAIGTGTLLSTVVRHPEDVQWFPDHVPSFDLSDTFGAISNPVTLVWGRNDVIIPVANGQRMHGLIKDSRLIILEGRGHIYPVTEPETAARYIREAATRYGTAG